MHQDKGALTRKEKRELRRIANMERQRERDLLLLDKYEYWKRQEEKK